MSLKTVQISLILFGNFFKKSLAPSSLAPSNLFQGAHASEDGGVPAWVLLPDTLDLSRQTDNFEAVRRGRDFLRDYDGEGRMFEPLWQDREQ